MFYCGEKYIEESCSINIIEIVFKLVTYFVI